MQQDVFVKVGPIGLSEEPGFARNSDSALMTARVLIRDSRLQESSVNSEAGS